METNKRPYGCTFQNCKKTCGSKSDWKRHENSQHFHLELWRCNLDRLEASDIPCAKICYRRETFQEHLKKEHQISNEGDINNQADMCRVGRNCQVRFWCGFCKSLIDLKKKGLEAWTERFDHIDDHFMGRNENEGCKKWNIDEWIHLDGEKLEEHEISEEEEEEVPAKRETVTMNSTKMKHGISIGGESIIKDLTGMERKLEAFQSFITHDMHNATPKFMSSVAYEAGENRLASKEREYLSPFEKTTFKIPTEVKPVISESQIIQEISKAAGSRKEIKGLPSVGLKTPPVLGVGIPIDNLSPTFQNSNEIIWSFYNICTLTLTKSYAAMKQHPTDLDSSSEKLLRLSSESLFLWGESFKASDFDFLMEWSSDLGKTIVQFLVEIAFELIQGLFPQLSDSTQKNLQGIISKLSITIAIVRGWQLKNCNTTHRIEDKQQNDDDDDGNGNDSDEDGEDSDSDSIGECVLNIHTSVLCLMDLIPSIERVLQQQAGNPKSLISLDQVDHPRVEVRDE